MQSIEAEETDKAFGEKYQIDQATRARFTDGKCFVNSRCKIRYRKDPP